MKKNCTAILIFGLLFPALLLGQGEASNWYFGQGAGLHFNPDGSVVPLDDGLLNSFEGCATISDPSGNLLFYTEGTTVYDRTHTIMMNGTGLFGDLTSSQAALIVPRPEAPNIYYIFTVNAFSDDGIMDYGFNYSVVDMSLNNGNGAVTLKNINLLADCAEKVTAVVKDCSAQSIWIITQASEDGTRAATGQTFYNTFHAFEVNTSGVVVTAVRSTFATMGVWDGRGYLKVSPDATKMASANYENGLFLYDFDADTGIVSNLQGISARRAYGIEFSPNSQYLYTHVLNRMGSPTGYGSSLLQYDLLSADIAGSELSLEDRVMYRGALQLGIDGKIYRTLTENFLVGTPYLGVINNPDARGAAANYQHNAIALNGNNGNQGLPPFVTSFLRPEEVIQSDAGLSNGALTVCEGEPLILQAQYIPGAVYTWEKDRVPLTNTTNNTFRVVSAEMTDAGNYVVTIIRPDAVECPIVGEITLNINPNPPAIMGTLLLCDSDTDNAADGITSIDLRQLGINPATTVAFYLTQTDRDNDIPIPDMTTYRNTSPFNQTLFYTLTNSNGCQSLGELQLEVITPPTFALDENYLLCTDDPILSVEGPVGFDYYRWLRIDGTSEQDIGTDPVVAITEIGSYILEVGMEHTGIGEPVICYGSYEFQVLPSNAAIINDVRVSGFSESKTIEIEVVGDGDYEFSVDGENYQESSSFSGLAPGFINVFVRDKNGCGITEERIEIEAGLAEGTFPAFFTPNGDGINDYWQVLRPANNEMNLETIFIFNRIGAMLAQIDPLSTGWDGTFNGRPLPSSDYWFMAISIENEKFKGHFSLKR